MIENTICCDECGSPLNGHAIFIEELPNNAIRIIPIETSDQSLVESYARRYKVACGEPHTYKLINRIFDRVFGRTPILQATGI